MHAQDQIKRAEQAQQDVVHCAKAEAPAALFACMDYTETSLLFHLKYGPAITAILRGLEELGWPEDLEDPDTARSGPFDEYITASM